MKKIIMIIIALIFLTSGVSFSGQQEKRHKRSSYKRTYQKNHPANHPRGHAYGHYKHKHRDRYRGYRYKGHYRWYDWNKERHHHRDRYRHGTYHHDDNGYLMFSYCDKKDGEKVCFSISID